LVFEIHITDKNWNLHPRLRRWFKWTRRNGAYVRFKSALGFSTKFLLPWRSE